MLLDKENFLKLVDVLGFDEVELDGIAGLYVHPQDRRDPIFVIRKFSCTPPKKYKEGVLIAYIAA